MMKGLDYEYTIKNPERFLAFLMLMAVIFFALGFGTGIAFADEIPEDVAVHCILGEARSQGAEEIKAHAEALYNRGTTKGVFGCNVDFSHEMSYIKAIGKYDIALNAWRNAAHSNLVDGADHWESTNFKDPYWAKYGSMTAHIGKTKFYKNVKR